MKESWNDRVSNDAGSISRIRHAAHKRALSQMLFLPIRTPIRKRLIMINDLVAGMLAPDNPK